MRRGSGATAALVVIARVRAGEEEEARDAIRAWWDPGDSPFAAVEGTHLARLQVLRPPRRRPRDAAAHVLLAADVDAPLWPWVERLRAGAGPQLDAVLGHCAFYPGSAEPAPFARFVAANRVEVGFSVIGSPGATTADVAAALALRDEVAAFAERTQLLDGAQLHAAWRAWRGR
jgi:hypothetical protein